MLIIYETMLNMGGSRSPYAAFSSVLGAEGGGSATFKSNFSGFKMFHCITACLSKSVSTANCDSL